MGVIFRWFKEYKITVEEHPFGWCGTIEEYKLHYIGGDSTSHSYGNRSIIQELFENKIPTINDEYIDSVDYDLRLVKPSEMSELCNRILYDCKVDEVDMRDRVEWIKKLSDEGYYISYDML